MKLKEAPFKIGDKLKYIGEKSVNMCPRGVFYPKDSDYKPLYYPGIIVTVTYIKPPMNGLGWQEDDQGEKWYDHGDHGYNVCENEYGLKSCVDADNMHEWELLCD